MSLNLQTTTAMIDENGELRGLERLESLRSRLVQVVIVSEQKAAYDDEAASQSWQTALAHNPAFAFLSDEAEDIYSWGDGRPINKSERT